MKGIDNNKNISEDYCQFIPEEGDNVENQEYKMKFQSKKNEKLAGISGTKILIDEAKHVGDKNI